MLHDYVLYGKAVFEFYRDEAAFGRHPVWDSGYVDQLIAHTIASFFLKFMD